MVVFEHGFLPGAGALLVGGEQRCRRRVGTRTERPDAARRADRVRGLVEPKARVEEVVGAPDPQEFGVINEGVADGTIYLDERVELKCQLSKRVLIEFGD